MQTNVNSSEIYTIICAWCDKVLNDKPLTKGSKQTHTICQKCLEKLKQEIKTVSQNSTVKTNTVVN